MPERILVVDDDPGMQTALREALKKRGYEPEAAHSAEEALEKVAYASYDLILLDVRLPGLSGIDAVPMIRRFADQGEIILMTAHGTQDTAREALRYGAYDYFTKPFSLKEFEIVVKRALERRKIRVEMMPPGNGAGGNGASKRIIGQSEVVRRVRAMVEKLAPLGTTVLITGESGTGKELVADVLHSLSGRANGPFVKINCASIPESLLESELCGHEKGAFTGAISQKAGKFEQAHGGTLLMDEVGDMPFSLQAKLLRLVEQKQFERLGGKKSIDVDVRIVAATNQDLSTLIKEKHFREDLYYRLNVGAIRLPPLRERKDDLPLLVEYFLERINRKLGTSISGVSREALELLFAHNWPGNVRELSNFLERAAILSSGKVLTGEDVRMAFQKAPKVVPAEVSEDPITLNETLEEVEKNLIIKALQKSGGRQCDAARMLGLNPKNLWKKIRKHGIEKIFTLHEDESSC